MFDVKSLAAAAAGCLLAFSASAATVTYQSAEADPKVQLVIDDAASPGAFRFSLSTIFGVADFLGLGFDFAGAAVAQGDISLVGFTSPSATPNTPGLVLFGNNTDSQSTCGNGCNFNGAGSAPQPFDYIVRIGENGGGDDFVSSVVFDIAVAGSLAANPFSNFGVRAQNTSGPSDSIKFGLVPVAPIPLPASGALLLAALVGAGFAGRRRRA